MGNLSSFGIAIVMLAVFCFFSVNAFIVPAVKKVAITLRWVDDPVVGGRKIHREPIPYLGGLAIYIGLFLAIGVYHVFLAEMYGGSLLPKWIIPYLTGGLLVLTVGTADDVYDMSPVRKLIAEICIASFVAFGGMQLDHIYVPGFGMLELGQMGYFVTVLVLVAAMNAVNIIDGMDGLAGSIVLVALTFNALLSVKFGEWGLFVVAILLCSAVLGFLRHNWHPARIFLGDGGSLFLGYSLAVIALKNIGYANNISELSVPLLALFYPVLDVLIAMYRRGLKGKPLMSGDRGHLHHRLFDLGWSQPLVVLGLAFFAALPPMAGYFFVYHMNILGTITALAFITIMSAGLMVFGYFNIEQIRNSLKMRSWHKVYNCFKKYAMERIRYAQDEEALWNVMVDSAKAFELVEIEWNNGMKTRTWGKKDGDAVWLETHMKITKGVVRYGYTANSDRDAFHNDICLLMQSIISIVDARMAKIAMLS